MMKYTDLDRLQDTIAMWHDRTFGEVPDALRALIVCEEAGELAHVILKQTQGIRPESSTDAHLRDAMGDIVIALCALAAARDWSLWDIVQLTATHVLMRTYADPTANLQPPASSP